MLILGVWDHPDITTALVVELAIVYISIYMKKTRNPKEINDVEGTQLSHFPFTVILGKLEGKLPSQKRYKAPTDQLMRH